MKKVYTVLLSALLLSTGASAQTLGVRQQLSNQHNVISSTAGSRLQSKAKPVEALKLQGEVAGKGLLKAPLNPTSNTIVEETPEGTLHNADFRSGIAFFNQMGSVYYSEYSNYIGKYVVDDNGIYLYYPFVGLTGNRSWLKLDHLFNNLYVAHLPQAVYEQEGETYYATRLTLGKDTSGQVNYFPDTTEEAENDVFFTYSNGTLSQNGLELNDSLGIPETIIGLTDIKGGWTGYGEAAITVTPNNLTTTKPANAAAAQDYTFNYTTWDEANGAAEEKQLLSKVAIEGNDVYINNPATADPDSWIKGSISGNKATFAKQYIGPDSIDNVHLWFYPGKYNLILDPEYAQYTQYGYYYYIRNYSDTTALDFNYNAADKSFEAADSASLLLSIDPDELLQAYNFDGPSLTTFTETEATPADPEITFFWEYDDDYGYGIFEADVPTKDTKGNFINPNKLYYNFYVDDPTKPYVLSPANGYSTTVVPEAYQTDVPYSYQDNFVIQSNGDQKTLYFLFDSREVDSVGIQSIYRGGNAEHRSNIVWQLTEKGEATDGISNVFSSDANVGKVAFYDLSGRRIAIPKQGGLYIKETTFADGTKKGTKFLKK